MTPDQAAGLAARTLAAIDPWENAPFVGGDRRQFTADRERVVSDLAGLLSCYCDDECGHVRPQHIGHARRYADNLLRTAELYGVTP